MRILALICAIVALAGCSTSTAGSGQALGAGTPTGTSTSITGWPSPTATASTPSPTTTRPTATPSPTPSRTPSPTARPTRRSSGRSAPATALRVLRAHGYDPLPPAMWYRTHGLNALVGVAHDSADGYVRLAFFFVDGRYIGTDTSQPSAIIHYVHGGDDTITLRYAIYRPNDAMCCPSRSADVRYHWNGHRLVPLDPIPPINGTGRR